MLIIHHKLPISSTKTMHGSSFMAKEKTAEESFWDSPYHLSVRDATSRLMKRAPASLATALASRVLPQPGGPCSNTPYRWSNTAKAGPELNMLEPTEASLTVGPQDYQLIWKGITFKIKDILYNINTSQSILMCSKGPKRIEKQH